MPHLLHHRPTDLGRARGEEPPPEPPRYLKAAGSDRMAPFYDLAVRLIMRERHVRRCVLEAAELEAGHALLDVGCGTGTLALMARQRHPGVRVFGVDGDPTILGFARHKARRAGADVRFDEAMADALPYPASSFDAVVSTLVLHHLTRDEQERALGEMQRVLRPGGRLVLLDFAPPHNRLMAACSWAASQLLRLHGLHAGGHAPLRPEVPAWLQELLAAEGWTRIGPPRHFMTLVGSLALHRAVRPAMLGVLPAGVHEIGIVTG